MPVEKTVIFDGSNLLWRSYSVPFKFYSKNGTPLHVVTTFLKQIRRTINYIGGLSNNDWVVVVFDTQTTNSNSNIYTDYKANRKRDFSNDEDSPFHHLDIIKSVLNTLRIKFLEIPNFEGDDIIATVCNQNKKENRIIYIVSTDTDFYQLVDENVLVLKLKSKDEFELINQTILKCKLGVAPKDYVYFKSLTGDKSDNIPGIFGIGPILAKKIITGETKFDLASHQSILERNQKLIEFNNDIPLDLDMEEFIFDPEVLEVTNQDIFQACAF